MNVGHRLRFAILVGLLVAFFGIPIWFGALPPAPEVGAYPGEDELVDDYDRYVGEHVAVSGSVVGTDPVTIRVEDGTGGTTTLRIVDLDVTIAEGEQLRVYGVAERGGEIRAVNAFTVPSWGMPYAVITSFLAGLWVLARLLRYWRVDLDERTLRRRPEPLRAPLVRLGDAPGQSDAGGDDDA